jgi:uncharacterized protein (DUF1778 family)
MGYHRAGRRSSGKAGSKRLGEKVFSYHSPEEKQRLQLAAEKQDLSLSSFVAKAANAEADRILEPEVEFSGPLSLGRLIQALKQGKKDAELVRLIREKGIDFKISEASEDVLRKAGAGSEVVLQAYKHKPAHG